MSYLVTPLTRFGGKANHLNKIIPHLEEIDHRIFVDVFAGSGAVLITKKPVQVEVLNDAYHIIADFFRVVRDEEILEKLFRFLALSPVSRELYYESLNWASEEDIVKRVANWFISIRQGFAGTPGSWSFVVTMSRRKMAANNSKWLSAIDRLPALHSRLQRVQIECSDWRRILDIYDTPETLFYLDPPYVPTTRRPGKYELEMTLEDHTELVDRIFSPNGSFALSGYPHNVYAPLNNHPDITIHSWETQCVAAGKTRGTGIIGDNATFNRDQRRLEYLWIRPKPLNRTTTQLPHKPLDLFS